MMASFQHIFCSLAALTTLLASCGGAYATEHLEPKAPPVTKYNPSYGLVIDTTGLPADMSPGLKSAWDGWHRTIGQQFVNIFDRDYFSKMRGWGTRSCLIKYKIENGKMADIAFVTSNADATFASNVKSTLERMGQTSKFSFPEQAQQSSLTERLTVYRDLGPAPSGTAEQFKTTVRMPMCRVINSPDFQNKQN